MKALAILGGTLIVIAGMFGQAVLYGWAISILWGWFVVPVFHAPPLSIAVGIGIAMTTKMIVIGYDSKAAHKDKECRTAGALFTYCLGHMFGAALYALMCVGAGWIIKQFI